MCFQKKDVTVRIAMQWALMAILYALGFTLLFWSLFIFFYQYIAVIGITNEVIKAFVSPRILSALWLSLTSAFATTFLAIIFGVPLAYIYAMKEFKGKALLETLTIDVPQTFPPVAEGIILLLMLGPSSPFRINIAYTFAALVVAKFFVSAPFIIAFTARKLREVRESGLDVIAKTLGANEYQLFWTILIPLSFKDIIAGASLCWARAMGELGGSLIFAGVIPYVTEVVPTFIEKNASATAPALAATILVTTASIIALLSFRAIVPGGGLWKAFLYRA